MNFLSNYSKRFAFETHLHIQQVTFLATPPNKKPLKCISFCRVGLRVQSTAAEQDKMWQPPAHLQPSSCGVKLHVASFCHPPEPNKKFEIRRPPIVFAGLTRKREI